MTGSFASVNTALSALRYNRVVMDVASGNLANAGSTGYTRRRVESEAVGGPARPAMWSRYDGAGDGVRVADLRRMTDQFVDTRLREERSSLSYLDVRRTTLERLETGIAEPGDHGVAAALADFRASWAGVANAPADDMPRSQVLSRASSLVDAIRTQAANVAREGVDARSRLDGAVAQTNTMAAELAALNHDIARHGAAGTDVNTLLDQRDVLAGRLAELTGGTATERADGGLDVTVGGVPLVLGREAGTLVVTSGSAVPVALAVRGAGGDVPVTAGLRGEVGAGADLLSVTLPAYAAGLDAVAGQLADELNAASAAGFDRSGAPGGPLFSYTPGNAAASLAVAVTDPGRLAASALPGGVVDGSHADAMTRASGVESGYQQLVNGLGTAVASVGRQVSNQASLVAQVASQREQLTGVNLDEEMVSLMSAQRAYEAAARVMSTVDSMLDTLINRTGLVGR